MLEIVTTSALRAILVILTEPEGVGAVVGVEGIVGLLRWDVHNYWVQQRSLRYLTNKKCFGNVF